ncbi:MAG: type II toxin-antitoxin system Phd/YefM family antitoxin [Mycobacteriales bacterium]
MTLHVRSGEVGVRELHDRLSEYLQRVEEGQEVLVTRRGQPIARLSAAKSRDPLAELAERGLVRLPKRRRSARRAQVKATGPVSDLVAEQRR